MNDSVLAKSGLNQELVAAYNSLVTTVTPVAVRLISVHMGATAFSAGTTEAALSGLPARWEQRDGGFTAIQPFKVEGTSGEGARFSLELELAVDYDSPLAMTNELFVVFGQNNLPLNAHPFLRETIASLTMRSGWPPLIVPAFIKQGKKPAAVQQLNPSDEQSE